jgi:predicted metal-binding protein
LAFLDDSTTLFVCVTCRGQGDPSVEPRQGARLFEHLQEEVGAHMVRPVECLSNCQRGCTVAVGAPGKWSYIIGNLEPERHVADVLTFARLHSASADGLTPWRERPAHVRKNTIARIPAMSVVKEVV